MSFAQSRVAVDEKRVIGAFIGKIRNDVIGDSLAGGVGKIVAFADDKGVESVFGI